jgi:hypothetical protein
MFRKDNFGITRAMILIIIGTKTLKNLRRMKTRLNLHVHTVVVYVFYITLFSYLVHKIISTYGIYNQPG